MNTNLWHATRQPDYCIENQLRSIRVWEYLEEATPPILYKDIKRELGLTYWQVIKALGLLCSLDLVTVSVTADWNGCNYIYPHRVWINTPVPVIRG